MHARASMVEREGWEEGEGKKQGELERERLREGREGRGKGLLSIYMGKLVFEIHLHKISSKKILSVILVPQFDRCMVGPQELNLKEQDHKSPSHFFLCELRAHACPCSSIVSSLHIWLTRTGQKSFKNQAFIFPSSI